ncbi:MAG: ACT domain-containing protein [Ignavibacteriales bacterium]|nr:ACT domain-containing protein [Ignavibacteriales bacterium]MBK7980328.1 ACT domain-containing protein [Ignavibacteriota bacterium]
MPLNENEIRKLTMQIIGELGSSASPDLVKKLVQEKIEAKEINYQLSQIEKSTGKVILTSFGMNHPGIIAAVTKVLSDANCDVSDLSQKLMSEFYTMIIILDISNSPKNLSELQADLNKVADELKIKIYLQHEDLFKYMHRV